MDFDEMAKQEAERKAALFGEKMLAAAQCGMLHWNDKLLKWQATDKAVRFHRPKIESQRLNG